MYSALDLRPLTLWHPTLIRVLRPSMPVEGVGRCCELLIGTEAWRDGEGVSGVQPGPLGPGDCHSKNELGIGRGVLCRRSESSRELPWLVMVDGGPSLSFAVVVGKMVVAGVAVSGEAYHCRHREVSWMDKE